MTKRSLADDDIIRGGLGLVTDKTTKKNRRQSKKPRSHIWLRGLIIVAIVKKLAGH